MNSLPLDIWAQFRAEGLVSDKIDRASRQFFQVELHAKVTLPICSSIKANKNVQVTIGYRLTASSLAKKGDINNTETLHEDRFVLT